MELPSYFADFLQEIRLTPNQAEDAKRGHEALCKRLEGDATIAKLLVSTFLQGSYRRATAIRPYAEKRADVDVVVVTKLAQSEYTPSGAQEVFFPFLDKFYEGKYRTQGRSLAIELGYVDLDLVITSAPSEAEIGLLRAASVTSKETPDDVNDWRLVKSWLPLERRNNLNAKALMEAAKKEAEWQLSPLSIPDRDVQEWEPTHPLAQIRWTFAKNRLCNRHYVNVIKAIKWWRRVNFNKPKYPKGYPVEHLIGQCCPDSITSVAEGVTRTLENIATNFQYDASLSRTPNLPDHGVPEHNVFRRVSGEDFAAFHSQVCDAAKIAREAFESKSIGKSVDSWKTLFGDKFPDAPTGDDDGNGPTNDGYTPRRDVSVIGGGRFA